MSDTKNSNSEKEKEKEKEELIERAEILFDHQKAQYQLAIDGLRRLEDKAMKIFGALSVIITLAILIVRYWWPDIFPLASNKHTPTHIICWFFLGLFLLLSLISWGYTFSAMQPQDFERPSSDATELENFFMRNLRYNSLTGYAKEYSRLTSTIDANHKEKVRMIKNCSESMLYGAWSFVIFLICFLLIKLTS
ncbi:hypothetical protein [Yersinia enterocolitica]|uniref:hypothetical protein n=1 Tax=Yersinia enterocolitica TaxID=630 RepID=UPI003F482AFA